MSAPISHNEAIAALAQEAEYAEGRGHTRKASIFRWASEKINIDLQLREGRKFIERCLRFKGEIEPVLNEIESWPENRGAR